MHILKGRSIGSIQNTSQAEGRVELSSRGVLGKVLPNPIRTTFSVLFVDRATDSQFSITLLLNPWGIDTLRERQDAASAKSRNHLSNLAVANEDGIACPIFARYEETSILENLGCVS